MCIHLQSQKLTFTWNDMFARYFACAYRPGEVCAYRPGEVCAYRPGAYVCPNYYCTFTTLSPCPTIISSTGPVGWFCIALTVAPSPADVVSKIRTKYTHPPPNTPEYPVNPWVALTLSNCLHSYGWSGVGWRGWGVGGWGVNWRRKSAFGFRLSVSLLCTPALMTHVILVWRTFSHRKDFCCSRCSSAKGKTW